ncbi:MAG: NYN domain-containing protein [Nitrosopumilus sp.]
MKHIAIFADVSNLYYCIGMKYPDRKLNYAAYYEYISELGLIEQAIAYGAQLEREAEGFIYCLKSAGFEPKYKTPKTYRSDGKIKRKADWDVGIAMDLVRLALDKQYDMLVLGSADGDLCPLVEWLKELGIIVIILACGISRDLRLLADQAIEIPESLLENKNVNTIQQKSSDSRKWSELTTFPIR